MTNLFLHQKKRGGIIDVDADDMNVISIGPEEQPVEEVGDFDDLPFAGFFSLILSVGTQRKRCCDRQHSRC